MMRIPIKIVGVLTSLSSIIVMSGVSLASSRPQPRIHNSTTVSTETRSLSTAQKTQAAQVARETENINTSNGYVSVSASVLEQHGLSPQQVSYVEDTIDSYDIKYGLTPTSIAPTSLAVVPTTTSISANTPIWYKSAAFTRQMVMLYEGLYQDNSWGWEHMAYRHNWTTAAGQKAVEITVHL